MDAVVELLQERSEAIRRHRDGREKMGLGLSDLNKVRGDLAGRLLAKRLCLDAEATEDRLPAPFGSTSCGTTKVCTLRPWWPGIEALGHCASKVPKISPSDPGSPSHRSTLFGTLALHAAF